MRILENVLLLSGVIHHSKRVCSSSTNVNMVELYQRCLKYLKDCPEGDLSSRAFLNIAAGNHSNYLQKPDDALKHFKIASRIFKELYGEKHHLYVINLARIADATRDLGQYKEALQLHQETLKKTIALYGENSYPTAEVYRGLALSFLALNDSENALVHFENSLNISRKRKFCAHLTFVNHKSLFQLYTNLGNDKKSQYHYERAEKLR